MEDKRHARRIAYAFVALLPLLAISSACDTIAVPDPNVRFVAFGDSTTAGPSQRDYPDILREMLAEPVEAFANEGVGGETSEDGLKRLRDILEAELFPNAEVWLHWEGGGDIADLIERVDPLLLFSPSDANYPFAAALIDVLDAAQGNIESAIRETHDEGLDVYTATYFLIPQRLTECPSLLLDRMTASQAARANEYLRLLNERIRLASVLENATLVDIETLDDELRADPANYFNCNHLSAQGNEIVATLFRDELLRRGR